MKLRLLVFVTVVAGVAAFVAFDLNHYLSFDYFLTQRAAFDAYAAAHPVRTPAMFAAAYVALTALSLPGAAIMSLIAGALFGLVTGTVIVSFASTIGATLAFLASRFLLRDWVRARLGDRLTPIDDGIAREGALYLFALRLVPLFPFWLINLSMGVTAIRTVTYYWVSQVGMLAGTVAYVYAGTQLAQFQISPGLVTAFVLLGIFPLLARRLLEAVKARRVYGRWAGQRPAAYDFNMVVIGAGSAGLVSAYIAAATQARVALVERHRMGGDCLNTGCVPSKALLRSAKRHRGRGPAFCAAHSWS